MNILLLSDDIILEILKTLRAKHVKSVININKKIKVIFADNPFIWKNIFHNTFTNKNIIEWDLNDDFKKQLKTSLANAKHTQLFRRHAFIDYLCDAKCIKIGENVSCTYEELKKGFTKYTNRRFRDLPQSSWETLYTLPDDKRKILINLANYCNYVTRAREVFLSWTWPRKPSTLIIGISILNK